MQPGYVVSGTAEAIRPSRRQAPAPIPNFGELAIPKAGESIGPLDGLTLDAAVDLLIRQNVELRSQALEIPQAQADILTAGLRANPLLFFDARNVPYGSYSAVRPGSIGYDLNITYPIDFHNKRRERLLSACRAKQVLQAQYQDAVRMKIDNLYTAFVDVLAAREVIRYYQAGLLGLQKRLFLIKQLAANGSKDEFDVMSVQSDLDETTVGLAKAEEDLKDRCEALALLLDIKSDGSVLVVQASLHDPFGGLPYPEEELAGMALEIRPDLASFRFGVQRAKADVRLARANRFEDVYLLYQPYTYQTAAPPDVKGAHSWAIGATIPMPIFNRNEGNIRRSMINVDQTSTQLLGLEQQVRRDVKKATRDYLFTLRAVRQYELTILPAAVKIQDHNRDDLLMTGRISSDKFLEAVADYNQTVRQYIETLIQHRRNMLALNTAIGVRLFP
jgi:cobalt-zinc-cadmium efflux system outer membrane protein